MGFHKTLKNKSRAYPRALFPFNLGFIIYVCLFHGNECFQGTCLLQALSDLFPLHVPRRMWLLITIMPPILQHSAFPSILKSIILFNRIVDSQGNCKVWGICPWPPLWPTSAHLPPWAPHSPVWLPHPRGAAVGPDPTSSDPSKGRPRMPPSPLPFLYPPPLPGGMSVPSWLGSLSPRPARHHLRQGSLL